jgi:probable HAF family extracellular repeat protein
MRLTTSLLALCQCVAICFACGCAQGQQEGATRLVQKFEGFQLEIFDNSDTLSRILAIDGEGRAVGQFEKPDEKGFVFTSVYFFDDGKRSKELGVLEGFTNSELEGLSSNSIAVGYSTRPFGNSKGGLTGMLWDTTQDKLIRLMPAKNDVVCQAQAISADGSLVVGYTTGSEPPRLRPCIWQRSGKTKEWECEVLPTKMEGNPLVMSSSVVISPDGKQIAACPAENVSPEGILDNALYRWTKDSSGKWQSEKLNEAQPHLHAINNSGLIVGSITLASGKRVPRAFTRDGEMVEIELLPGTQSGVAYSVNSDGFVVGTCDDPSGPDGGPHAFVWKDGKTLPLALPETTYFSFAESINDRGQIAGFADITFPDRKSEDAESSDEPLVKTLGFIWTPKNGLKEWFAAASSTD